MAVVIFGVLLGSMVYATQVYAAPQAITVKCELSDTHFYSTMGAKGPSHRDWAVEYVKKGIPAGILEEGTNRVLVWLPNKDNRAYPAPVFEKKAQGYYD
jgi:hypothetical protein